MSSRGRWRLRTTAAKSRTPCARRLGRADLVITTGGLGPTSDDLTRELIAELLGKKLVENQDVLAHIENFFAKRGPSAPGDRRSVETLFPKARWFF